jgi:hypothetical protein
VPQIRSAGWTGDGWKCAFEIAATQGLDFRLIAIDHGVAVVRPTSPDVKLADLAPTLAEARFTYLAENIAGLPLVDYAEGRAWIRAQITAPKA